MTSNPTSSTFVLQVKSTSNAALEVTVYNSEGKRIHLLKTVNFSSIVIGENYKSGSYLFEVRQGEKRETVIGLKM